jgi:hypothetical protein
MGSVQTDFEGTMERVTDRTAKFFVVIGSGIADLSVALRARSAGAAATGRPFKAIWCARPSIDDAILGKTNYAAGPPCF